MQCAGCPPVGGFEGENQTLRVFCSKGRSLALVLQISQFATIQDLPSGLCDLCGSAVSVRAELNWTDCLMIWAEPF